MFKWTTEDVRCLVSLGAGHNPVSRHLRVALFEAWLAETRAEAWDDGLNAAIEADIEDARYGNHSYPDNPYRTKAD